MAVALITKGMIDPVRKQATGNGSGGAGLVRRDEVEQKPKIIVKDVTIESEVKETLTADNVKVKTLKIISEYKD